MGWYNASWINRIAITVDHTKVGASLTNFPVYLDLSKLPAAFFSNVRSDGGDIRMTKSDGTTEVAREIVSIDTVGKTGEVHFNAPSLSNTVDTVFYIYYNNPSATDYATNATYGAQNVWDSNYGGVWHMNDGADSSHINDSTSNQITGTKQVAANPLASTGKIGIAQYFDGTNSHYIDLGNNCGFTTFTIEYWLQLVSGGGTNQKTVSKSDSGTVPTPYDIGLSSTSHMVTTVGQDISNYTNYTGTNVLSTGSWYYYVSLMDGSKNVSAYENMTTDVPSTLYTLAGPTNTTNPLSFGNAKLYNNAPLKGYLDEIRISKIARATTWLSTQYNNQNSSSTFYTIGGQEIQSTGGIHGTLSMMGVGM